MIMMIIKEMSTKMMFIKDIAIVIHLKQLQVQMNIGKREEKNMILKEQS